MGRSGCNNVTTFEGEEFPPPEDVPNFTLANIGPWHCLPCLPHLRRSGCNNATTFEGEEFPSVEDVPSFTEILRRRALAELPDFETSWTTLN